MSNNYDAMKKLFPVADIPADTELDLQVFALSLDRLCALIGRLAIEINPATASDDTQLGLLADWEGAYGSSGTDLATRRQNLLVKISTKPALTFDYYYALAEALGFGGMSGGNWVQFFDGWFPPWRVGWTIVDDDDGQASIVWDNTDPDFPPETQHTAETTWLAEIHSSDPSNPALATLEAALAAQKPAGSDLVLEEV